MRFEGQIPIKYRDSIERAFDSISRYGSDEHRKIVSLIRESEMSVRARPVSELNASGITGLKNASETSEKIAAGPIGLSDALGEVYIAIAFETIDTGGQRGCEGTFVHEGRHALDFARVIESYSIAAINPLSIFDPTLFELEWEAHRTSGEYMLAVGQQEYLDEGVSLKILGHNDSRCYLDVAGIERRLLESYGLERGHSEGPLASKLLGLRL